MDRPLLFLSSSTVKPLALCLRYASIKQLPDDVGLTGVGSLEGPLRRCPNGWSTRSSLCWSGCNSRTVGRSGLSAGAALEVIFEAAILEAEWIQG